MMTEYDRVLVKIDPYGLKIIGDECGYLGQVPFGMLEFLQEPQNVAVRSLVGHMNDRRTFDENWLDATPTTFEEIRKEFLRIKYFDSPTQVIYYQNGEYYKGIGYGDSIIDVMMDQFSPSIL